MNQKPQRKLGCNPSPTDKRMLWLSDYLRPVKLPDAPKAADWTKKVTKPWGMMRNDAIGDCVFAAAGHALMGWTFNAGKGFVPDDDAIVAAYSDVTGFDPEDLDTDQGANPLSALKFWKRYGIAGHTIGAYVGVNVGREVQYRQSINLFGSVQMAFALPKAIEGFDAWDIPSRQPMTGAWKPYSLGGHMVVGVKYDSEGVYVVTWGELMKVSWRFVAGYCDEAYCVLSPDIVNGEGHAPTGFHMEELREDLRAVGRV